MSEGEKKRVSLAAALLGNPSVLLLDDPSAELFDLILMLGKHKTVLLGGGDFAMMKELCEDVVILADGMLLASGNFADLEEALVKNSEMESLSALYDSIVEISRRKEPKKSSLWSGEERER